jgi:hypothetical protein
MHPDFSAAKLEKSAQITRVNMVISLLIDPDVFMQHKFHV